MKKLFLVDDHPLMREGLSMILESHADLTVIDQADSAEEALDKLGTLQPDLTIVDISLPGMSGLDLVKQLSALHPDMKILVLSRHDEHLYAERSIRAGAKGYVMKVRARTTIIDAVHKVLEGGIYVSPEINEKLIQGMLMGHKAFTASPLEVLSDRELDVFELTGKGFKTSEIADKLHISTKTVESYRTRIKDKLNLGSSTELMKHAVQWVEGT